MGRHKKVKQEGYESHARQEDRDEILAKKRNLLLSRKAATIHASPVDNKRKAKVGFGLVPDSIALRVKRQKPYLQNSKTKRYDDEDNIFFLTEMLKLVGSDVDGHEVIRNINIRELYGQVRKRFGPNYKQRQVYEKVRRLRRMYVNKLDKSADQGAVFEDANKEEIFKLCHQLWGDCGVLKLHLEDEDGPVHPNDRPGFSSGDAASSRENDSYGLEGVVSGRDTEIEKDAHAEVDNNVFIVSSIHQHDSHGLKGVVPGTDMVVDKGAHAELDNHVPSHKEMHVCLCQDVTEKPGERVTELASQKLYEVLHDNHRELLQALEKKCDLVLEGVQARVMTMVTNALETRDEPSMERFIEMLKPAGLPGDDKFGNRMLTGSMHESNISTPKHLQERWQRLRADELKLVSDKLHLMLEVCRMEQAKLERQFRHS